MRAEENFEWKIFFYVFLLFKRLYGFLLGCSFFWQKDSKVVLEEDCLKEDLIGQLFFTIQVTIFGFNVELGGRASGLALQVWVRFPTWIICTRLSMGFKS